MADLSVEAPGLADFFQTRKLIQDQLEREQVQNLQRRFIAERETLGANATPEALTNLALRYATPAQAVQYGMASQDRKAAIAQHLQSANQANQTRLDYLEEKRIEAERNATNQQERDRSNNEIRRQQLGIQQQIADSNEILKRLGIDIQQQRADQAAGQQTQRQTQNLGTALERAGLHEANATLMAAEEALQKRPDLPEYMSGIKSLAPDVALPQDITAGRQAFQKVFNIVLKNRSGAAVTPPEFERLKQEFGTGLWKKPEQFVEALKQARNIISQHYRGIAAGYGPDAIEGYNQNLRDTGGTPLLENQGTNQAQGPTSAPGAASPYVEIRTTRSGKRLGKRRDGTVEEIR